LDIVVLSGVTIYCDNNQYSQKNTQNIVHNDDSCKRMAILMIFSKLIIDKI